MLPSQEARFTRGNRSYEATLIERMWPRVCVCVSNIRSVPSARGFSFSSSSPWRYLSLPLSLPKSLPPLSIQIPPLRGIVKPSPSIPALVTQTRSKWNRVCLCGMYRRFFIGSNFEKPWIKFRPIGGVERCRNILNNVYFLFPLSTINAVAVRYLPLAGWELVLYINVYTMCARGL